MKKTFYVLLVTMNIKTLTKKPSMDINIFYTLFLVMHALN